MKRGLPLGSVPAIVAPVPTIIAPILTPIAAAADAPDRNRGRAGHRSSPGDRRCGSQAAARAYAELESSSAA